MCWRGHAKEFHIVEPNGSIHCRRCHALRVRAYRSGYPSRKRPLYQMNAAKALSIKRRLGITIKILADLSGISNGYMGDLLYKGSRAGIENARNIANALRCEFSLLWR